MSQKCWLEEKPPTCGVYFSPTLSLRIYESTLFFWHNRAYHAIVCGTEQNQQILNENTSELEDGRAHLVNCFQLNCLAWKKREHKRCWVRGRECREKNRFVLILFWMRQTHTHRRAECTTRSSAQPWGNRAWTLLREWAILSVTQICYLFPNHLLNLVFVCVCVVPFLQTYLSHSDFLLSDLPIFPHRSGISSLWSVWRYWPVTQAQCCVCSMMSGSSSPGLLTQLSGMHMILVPRISGKRVVSKNLKLC